MTADPNRYVLRGGRAGYDRLLVLARDRAPDTADLFDRAGLRPGMRALDLGCGGGEVTFELARRVGPAGAVVGIDLDPVKLELARAEAGRRGLANVEFREMRVEAWNEPTSYDAVYTRFLLQHLRQPVELLARMWAALRPGGVLIAEDADFDAATSEPRNEGHAFWVRTYCELLRRHGGDPACGRRLVRHCFEAGIPSPSVRAVGSVRYAGEGKSLARSTLEATAELLVSEGIATLGEVDDAVRSLEEFERDPRTLLVGPRIYQVYAYAAPPGTGPPSPP